MIVTKGVTEMNIKRLYCLVYRICVACCVLLIASDGASADTVFRDTFDDRNSQDGMPVTWVPDSGTWDAASGDYVTSGSAIRLSISPDHVLSDTSVRTQIRLGGENEQGLGAGIAFRRTPGDIFFGYGASLLDNTTLGLFRVDGGPGIVVLDTATASFDVVGQDISVQIDAFEDQISMWAWPAGETIPASPQVVVSDSTYTEGNVGIFSNESPGVSTFRFVHAADTHIPEPSTTVLAVLGLGGALAIRRNLLGRTRELSSAD